MKPTLASEEASPSRCLPTPQALGIDSLLLALLLRGSKSEAAIVRAYLVFEFD